MNNKLMDSERSQQELMDGYDVVRQDKRSPFFANRLWLGVSYRAYQIEKPKVGKPVKIYRFGYPDYKTMIKKHPELKVLQLI